MLPRSLLAAVAVWTALGANPLLGQVPLSERWGIPSLVGVSEFHVAVENLAPDCGRIGFTKEQVRTETELELRRVGLPVAPGVPNLTRPFLYVEVTCLALAPVLATPSDLTSYFVRIAFVQQVVHSMELSGPFLAVTWETYTLHVTARSDAAYNNVRRLASQFANDYLTANPRR